MPIKLKNIRDAAVRGKKVLVRVDFNVPLEMQSGHTTVVEDFRIRAVLPTINFLIEQGAAKISILTHVGRPQGKIVEDLRVAPIAARLQELVNAPQIEVLENLRFDPREETNDPVFAQELAALGDVYVNEAFPVSHRPDASIVGVPKLLPSYAGLRFAEEVEKLSVAFMPPPGSVAIIGGTKFETKIPLLVKLLPLYKNILLGGALGNDLIKARGLPFGSSLISETPAPIELASDDKILMLQDAVLASSEYVREGLISDIRKEEKIVDIGPTTATAWAKLVSAAPFVLWNGPLGIYEDGFTGGTDTMAQAVTMSNKAVVGGGDTIAAVSKFSFDPEKVFLSTGGGAMLEFLANGTLPGIEPLKV